MESIATTKILALIQENLRDTFRIDNLEEPPPNMVEESRRKCWKFQAWLNFSLPCNTKTTPFAYLMRYWQLVWQISTVDNARPSQGLRQNVYDFSSHHTFWGFLTLMVQMAAHRDGLGSVWFNFRRGKWDEKMTIRKPTNVEFIQQWLYLLTWNESDEVFTTTSTRHVETIHTDDHSDIDRYTFTTQHMWWRLEMFILYHMESMW